MREIMQKNVRRLLAAMAVFGLVEGSSEPAQAEWHNVKRIRLPVATQGPLWPPAEVADKNGNFLLIGNELREVSPGSIGMVPGRALLVSKETVPPLDANGVEDPDNWFGAPYKIIRELDLSRGSKDLKTVLYSLSFGPTVTKDGSPRIPAVGDSPFNLNKDLIVCPEIFPTLNQEHQFFRPAYPLHRVPIVGFQGDGVRFDPNTGSTFDPETASNDPACAATGCPGEDPVDELSDKPITLGDWLKSKGDLDIRLTHPNRRGQFTRAKFSFDLRGMVPNSIYTVWVVRPRTMPVPGVFERRDIDPIASMNVITTDAHGRGEAEFDVGHPFPDAAVDPYGLRIIGLSVVYHSNHQNWGACFSPYGPGTDVHVVFNTLNAEPKVPGTLPDFTEFVTVPR